MNSRDVAGVGALNVDYFYEVDDLAGLSRYGLSLHPGREISCDCHALSQLLEILKQEGRLKMKSGGGSAANTVVALAGMSFATAFCGRVGADEQGSFILQNMRGVDLTRVVRGGRSGTCVVVLDRKRDRALLVQPNANEAFTSDEHDATYLSNYRYVHMSSFAGDKPLQAQTQLARMLPDHVQVTLDPGELYAKRGLKIIGPLLERASILFITDHEAHILTGREDYRKACRDLLGLGPRIVVCKRGAEGACAATTDMEKEVVSRRLIEVLDNTGAGDVFNAGFLAGMLLNKSLQQSLHFAHTIAVRSLGAFGRGHYPTPKDRYLLEEETA